MAKADFASEQSYPSISRWLMYAVSFWGGLQIMVLELCGFRVLQTILGSSVVVTGTLLTLVMVLLAGGYYFGGVLSTRLKSVRGLLGLLLIAAVYTEVVATLFLDEIGVLGMALHRHLGGSAYLGSVAPASVLTLLLYGPPMFLMSIISPCWIKLATGAGSSKQSDTGVQAGFFMTLSTLGSIAGTLLASYLLIPFFGVAITASLSNAVFLVLVVCGWFWLVTPPPKVALA